MTAQSGNDPDRTEWFRDVGFGLFLHWGPSSQLGSALSWPIEDASEEFRDAYRSTSRTFDPTDYDPERWARLAALAGMGYVVFTSKHHDGFCMFDSEYTEFDVSNTPYGGDVAGELADAFRSAGLGVGFYYSPPDLEYQRATGNSPGSIRDPDYERAFEEWTDPYGPEEVGFLDYETAQVEELLTNYGDVDVLFFDSFGSCEPLKEHAWAVDADVVVSRGEMDTPELTFEGLPEEIHDEPWEACMTMQRRSWAAKPAPAYGDDDFHSWKPARLLIERLVETRAKGGNLLLNVGPQADGTLPDAAVDRLRNLAYWNAVHGDAVHAVRPWVTSDEGDGDVWFTREKDEDTVYAVFDPGWSAVDEEHETTVSLESVEATEDTTARLLGRPTDAEWTQREERLDVTVRSGDQPLYSWYWPRYDWPVAVRLTDVRPAGE
ncbi:MAG: alpha-L-fucosidase [Halobacteriaceae archaeon]